MAIAMLLPFLQDQSMNAFVRDQNGCRAHKTCCALLCGIIISCAIFWPGHARAQAGDAVLPGRVFRPAADGGFEFDTGVLRGRLAKGAKPLGLTDVVHVPSGARLDGSNGLLSHYRVFTRGKRYGGGAWDWPCKVQQLSDAVVEIVWPAEEPERPFELRARYEWLSPTRIELRTTVVPTARLEAFEAFLASYCSPAFTNAMVWAKDGGDAGAVPVLKHALKAAGDWQMFARDELAREVIMDGRWKLPPNPVDWAVYPVLAKPVGVRRAESLGLSFVLVGTPRDCFAIATPHESEGHYSMYLCLWGRDMEAGRSATTRTRLELVSGDVNAVVGPLFDDFMRGAPRRWRLPD
ncbi:MAG: hypothetical protein GX456_19300 [Verrucomicrobia bacterium]|nr:hypothetical protein [Verrucomicrobiota bacterium]